VVAYVCDDMRFRADTLGASTLGPTGPLSEQDRRGDFSLPERGVCAMGEAASTSTAHPSPTGDRRPDDTHHRRCAMSNKAVISLATGMEDPEKVMVAFLVAVGAAEQGRPTLMFLTKEAVRLALDGVATGTACEGCPPLSSLLERYGKAGGTYLVCPICFDAKKLDKDMVIAGAEFGGTVPMWQWIGDDGATTFSY
jgi:predicted peroxiredoxin